MQLIKAKTKRNSNSCPLLEGVHELYEGQFNNAYLKNFSNHILCGSSSNSGNLS